MKTAVAKTPAVRTTSTDADSSILLPNVTTKDFKISKQETLLRVSVARQ